MPRPALPLADLKLRMHEVGELSRGQYDERDHESVIESIVRVLRQTLSPRPKMPCVEDWIPLVVIYCLRLPPSRTLVSEIR